MIPEIDIWRCAQLLAKRYGDAAPRQAAEQADALLAAGDPDGCATWKRILAATLDLQSKTPAAGERVH